MNTKQLAYAGLAFAAGVIAYSQLRRAIAKAVNASAVDVIDEQARNGSARAVALRPFADIVGAIAQDTVLKTLPRVPFIDPQNR